MAKKSRLSAKKSRVNRISTDKSRKKQKDRNGDSKKALVEGEERKIHEEIIDRRIRGGASLTKEDITKAYDRALKQWQELPGSIVRPPSDVTLPAPSRRNSQDTKSYSERTHDETANGGQ